MEFLRFGSSIPGSYWGCCAVDIIQNFKFDPDTKASIQLVDGDGGAPVGNNAYAGPTYRDIFHQRIRFGTFDTRDMPNHGFIAILTESQVNGGHGAKWLAILKEAGFEFIRTVSNSVYGGQSVLPSLPDTGGSYQNHIFGLFRNIGSGAVADPCTPPKAWTDLPSVKIEAWQYISDSGNEQARSNGAHELSAKQFAQDKAIWEKIGPPKLLTEKEVVAAGAPVVLAGLRSEFPQQPKEDREQAKKWKEKAEAPKPTVNPF